jgi:hypothetical protein
VQRSTPQDQGYPRQHQQGYDHRNSPPPNATIKAGSLGAHGGKVYRLEHGPGTIGLTTVNLRRRVQGIAASPAICATGGLCVTALRASNFASSLAITIIHRRSRQHSSRSVSTCLR